ncbi:MAG TPA: tetratricopeptide repeat protein [Thiotrichales bacterium]|nr:tetratricopeptide repeat protein [Thiotrichales bacterium]
MKGVLPILLATLIVTGISHAHAARNGDKNIGWPGKTLKGEPCQGKEQGFGPFDYNDPTYTVPGLYTRHGSSSESPLRFVEKAHFTPPVERLQKGRTAPLPFDIDYTLRAFPNHLPALWSMIRFQLRYLDKKGKYGQRTPIDQFPPPECYLQRAEVFAPEDNMVKLLHAIYLHKRGILDEALKYYTRIEKALANNPELHYNMGLLYYRKGDIAKAREHAKRAYELGYQLPGLRNLLRAHDRAATVGDKGPAGGGSQASSR